MDGFIVGLLSLSCIVQILTLFVVCALVKEEDFEKIMTLGDNDVEFIFSDDDENESQEDVAQ